AEPSGYPRLPGNRRSRTDRMVSAAARTGRWSGRRAARCPPLLRGPVLTPLVAFPLACACGLARAAAPVKAASHGCHGDATGDPAAPPQPSTPGCAHCRVAMAPVPDHGPSAPPRVWSLAPVTLPAPAVPRLDGSSQPRDPAARAPARALLRLKCVLLA